MEKGEENMAQRANKPHVGRLKRSAVEGPAFSFCPSDLTHPKKVTALNFVIPTGVEGPAVPSILTTDDEAPLLSVLLPRT